MSSQWLIGSLLNKNYKVTADHDGRAHSLFVSCCDDLRPIITLGHLFRIRSKVFVALVNSCSSELLVGLGALRNRCPIDCNGGATA
jgi:hypothetical protein